MRGAADIQSKIIQVLRHSGERTVGELCRLIDAERMSEAPTTMAQFRRISWISMVCESLDDLVGLGLVEVRGDGAEVAVFRVTDRGKRFVVGADKALPASKGPDQSPAFA